MENLAAAKLPVPSDPPLECVIFSCVELGESGRLQISAPEGSYQGQPIERGYRIEMKMDQDVGVLMDGKALLVDRAGGNGWSVIAVPPRPIAQGVDLQFTAV